MWLRLTADLRVKVRRFDTKNLGNHALSSMLTGINALQTLLVGVHKTNADGRIAFWVFWIFSG
jgi:hypothetical protein